MACPPTWPRLAGAAGRSRCGLRRSEPPGFEGGRVARRRLCASAEASQSQSAWEQPPGRTSAPGARRLVMAEGLTVPSAGSCAANRQGSRPRLAWLSRACTGLPPHASGTVAPAPVPLHPRRGPSRPLPGRRRLRPSREAGGSAARLRANRARTRAGRAYVQRGRPHPGACGAERPHSCRGSAEQHPRAHAGTRACAAVSIRATLGPSRAMSGPCGPRLRIAEPTRAPRGPNRGPSASVSVPGVPSRRGRRRSGCGRIVACFHERWLSQSSSRKRRTRRGTIGCVPSCCSRDRTLQLSSTVSALFSSCQQPLLSVLPRAKVLITC
jgi:hypothetical protein